MIDAAEEAILDFLQEVYDAVGWPGVVFFMAVESAAIPLPSELIMPLAGWLLVRNEGLDAVWLLLAGFYGALGNLLGSLVAYYVAAWGGRPLLDRFGRFLLISRHDLERADRWFDKYGTWAVFFSRLLPVVRTFVSVPAGVSRMGVWRFGVLTFAGSYPWSLGLAAGGYVLGENWERLRDWMRPADIPIAAGLILLVVWYVYRHVRRSRPSRPAPEG